MDASLLNTRTTGFLEPERLIEHFGFEKGDFVADFGAGHGFFTIPIARKVGHDGRVFAIDIQKSELDIVRNKARFEHLLNVEFVWADLDQPRGSKFQDECVDFVIVSNILFQAEQKGMILEEAYRILRKGGRLAVIEWDSTPVPLGPPMDLRIPKETAEALARGVGFSSTDEFDAGNHHYCLVFTKK